MIPEKGSVGASGDLAPLGHMAMALIGEGYVFFKGRKCSTGTALKKARVKPLELHAKEGLSLINGTQVSTALAIKALLEEEGVLETAIALVWRAVKLLVLLARKWPWAHTVTAVAAYSAASRSQTTGIQYRRHVRNAMSFGIGG